MTAPERDDPALRDKLAALLASYERYAGTPLCTLDALFDAPFAVLAHGTEDPPLLFYGNRRALALWKMDFARFTRMPSRDTAEPDARDARERFMAQVREKGAIFDYTGVRIASDGSRFRIERATVWNILAPDGTRIGQAATFASVTPL